MRYLMTDRMKAILANHALIVHFILNTPASPVFKKYFLGTFLCTFLGTLSRPFWDLPVKAVVQHVIRAQLEDSAVFDRQLAVGEKIFPFRLQAGHKQNLIN